METFDLLAVPGTLRSLLQHHDSKASRSLVLSLPYGPILTSVHDYWKNHSIDYESESEVAQLCPTLCDPMDGSLPGSKIHGIF